MNKQRKANFLLRILLKLVFCFVFLAGTNLSAQVKVLNRCGKSALLEKDGQKVLVLKGNPYEMGYQHGVLLKEEIKKLTEVVLMISYATKPGSLERAWQATKNFIPSRYLEEMKGLADGAEIPLEKVQLANLFPELFHCSGIAVFGKATKNGELLHGRILDYMTEIGMQKFATVTVFQPDKHHAFITAGFTGFIGSVTGMNDRQIAVGEMGGGGAEKWSGVPMSFLVRRVLEEADSLDSSVKVFQDSPRTCEYYYVISDGKIPDARTLYCIPERVDVFKPGEAYPGWPEAPPQDTIIASGDDRYVKLLQRIKENYGKIDRNLLVEIMKRPVAMQSNLHNAIFAPAEGKMWLAVAADPTQPDFQACYQTYTEYDFKKLQSYAENSIVTVQMQPGEEEKGILKSSSLRPMKGEEDKKRKEFLGLFSVSEQNISWHLKLNTKTTDFNVWKLTFPSPVKSPFPENNTVPCEYYQNFAKGEKKPAVVVLDITASNLQAARLIACQLASRSVNSLIVTLPYLGERTSKNLEKSVGLLDDPEVLRQGLIQAVSDIRVAATWLGTRPENDPSQIGICGVSLGGLAAALAAGVDGNFPKAAFILAGGDLFTIIKQDSKETKKARQVIAEKNISDDDLQRFLEPFDPSTYTGRMAQTDVLMVNMEADTVIPASAAEKLQKSLPKVKIKWYPGDHYALIPRAFEVLDLVGDHFAPDVHLQQPLDK
ncbi:MAG: C45 family peptidase [Candidatus Omnitrophota bacterium]